MYKKILESKKLIVTLTANLIMLVVFLVGAIKGIFLESQSFYIWSVIFGLVNGLYLGGQAAIDALLGRFFPQDKPKA